MKKILAVLLAVILSVAVSKSVFADHMIPGTDEICDNPYFEIKHVGITGDYSHGLYQAGNVHRSFVIDKYYNQSPFYKLTMFGLLRINSHGLHRTQNGKLCYIMNNYYLHKHECTLCGYSYTVVKACEMRHSVCNIHYVDCR